MFLYMFRSKKILVADNQYGAAQGLICPAQPAHRPGEPTRYRHLVIVDELSQHIGLTESAAVLDLTDIDLSEYKGIVLPWNNRHTVQA